MDRQDEKDKVQIPNTEQPYEIQSISQDDVSQREKVEEEENFDFSPSELFGFRTKLSFGGNTPEIKADIDRINEQEDIPDKKAVSSDVAEAIARHVKDIRLDSSPLSNDQLLGSNIGQAISDYAKREGFDDAATDYAITMAYFHSEAFEKRLVRALGHETLDEMSVEERRTYDEILNKARQATDKTDVYYIKEAINSFFTPLSNNDLGKNNLAFMGANDVLGLSVAAHEVAHALYNPFFDDIIDHRSSRYDVNMKSYQTLDERPSSIRKIKETYKDVLQDMERQVLFASGAAELTKEEKKGIRNRIREHDDSRFERAADVYGVRMLMLREGLWNPFSGEEITPDKVKEFKKLHPDSRIFQYWNIKEATYYLNNLASNDNSRFREDMRHEINSRIAETLAMDSKPSGKQDDNMQLDVAKLNERAALHFDMMSEQQHPDESHQLKI